MKINELYKQGIELLEQADNDNAKFDARCLLEDLLKVDTTKFVLIGNKKADTRTFTDYMKLVRRCALGEPLQYILGKWEFMGNSFYVGKGVLIPRSETEILVDYADKFLKDKSNPVVFDLCSGSGCIAISIAKNNVNSTVYAIEKSEEAFEYLNKNIVLNKVKNVKPILGDICNPSVLDGITPDLIVSNPPYIKSDEIPFLQNEVRHEPVVALDGGKDGYDFYRVLSNIWMSKLQKGASMAVECGEDQADEISQMFYLCRTQVDVINDLSGFPRVVTAIK